MFLVMRLISWLVNVQLVCVTIAANSCRTRHVDMVFVQDASQSFTPLFAAMKTSAQELADHLLQLYDTINFALTTFVDKPIPFRGVGYGRGFSPEAPNPDYCYKRITQLSEDPKSLTAGFDILSTGSGQSGGDAPENPYEGLLYAIQDPSLHWSIKEDDIKFAVIVTDDLPHYAGDGQLGINWWTGNGDQGAAGEGQPHFWDSDFIHTASYYPVDAPAILPSDTSEADYTELIDLHTKINAGENMTKEELAKYNKHLRLYGPDTYDDLNVNIGTFEDYVNCHSLEYPSLEIVGSALIRERIIPLVLFATPDNVSTESQALCESRGYPLDNDGDLDSFVKCALQIYDEDLRSMDIDLFRIEHFTNEVSDFVEAVKTIVSEISGDIDCDDDDDSTAAVASTQDCQTISGGQSSKGTIAGIAIGCATAGAALTGLCTFLICYRPIYMTRLATEESRSQDIAEAVNIATAQLITEREQTQLMRVDDFA